MQNTYNVTGNTRSVSKEFFQLQTPNTTLLNRVRNGGKAIARTHEWYDDPVNRVFTKLSAGYTAADGQLTVVDTYGIKVDNFLSIGDTVFKVTAVNTSTKVVTVTVVASDADHTTSEMVMIMGADKEGKDYADDTALQAIRRENQTQIFLRHASVTGTQEAVTMEGGLTSALAMDVMRKMKELRVYMNNAMWNGFQVKPSDNTQARAFNGLNRFILTNGLTDTKAWTQANINAFISQLVVDRGADIRQIYVNPLDAPTLSSLLESKTQISNEVQKLGNFVGFYQSSNAAGMIIVLQDQAVPAGNMFFINENDIMVKPLREFSQEPLAKTGDSSRVQIVGEYTVEIHNSATFGRLKKA